jgi:hypothetical protein
MLNKKQRNLSIQHFKDGGVQVRLAVCALALIGFCGCTVWAG